MKTNQKNEVQNSKVEASPSVKKINNPMYKKIVLSSLMLFISTYAFAATATTVSGQISTWKATVKSSLDAAVLVFAIVGAFLIFVQYMQGNEQAQKNLIRFVIGLAVFGLATLIAQTFIGS